MARWELSRQEANEIAERLQKLGNDAAKDVRRLTGERIDIADIVRVFTPVYADLAAITADLFKEGRD